MAIDDEILMALADGELDPQEAARVSAAIADDPLAQARLRRFAETRARLSALRKSGGNAANDDDALIARIRAATLAPDTAARTVAAPTATANRNRAPWAALAAALAAAVVGIGWWQMGGSPPGSVPTLTAAQIAALDSLPSGQGTALSEGGDLTMIASYRTADGTLCREYETARGSEMTVSVACRDDGAWQMRFASDIAAPDAYVPASGDLAAVEDWLAESGAGDPLTPEAEAAALAE